MSNDIDVARQAIEERDQIELQYHHLANEMIYQGNSVGWWYSKATAYKAALGEAWDALHEAGVSADGRTTVADAIRKLAERKDA